MSATIELRNVSKRFAGRDVVADLSLHIGAGETCVIMGSSGGGKSTTLRMINRLVEPSAGSVYINCEDVRHTKAAALRRRIGYVIQGVGLLPHYDIRRNVGLLLERLGWPKPQIRQRVDELLELVGLRTDEYAHRFPHQLSGGERQRVGIARALATDPPIVLLDEPFSALDASLRERLQDEFVRLSATLKKTFVWVTHDIFEAVKLGDHIAVLHDGTLAQWGTPQQIVHQPAHPFVEALLSPQRLQLRWMTKPLRDLDLPAAGLPTNQDAATLELDAKVSIWSAVEQLERSGAPFLRIGTGASQVIDRRSLFAAIGEAAR